MKTTISIFLFIILPAFLYCQKELTVYSTFSKTEPLRSEKLNFKLEK